MQIPAPVIFALDTALDHCSVAVRAPDGRMAGETMPMPRGHAEQLFPMAARVLAAAGLTYADLGMLAVTLGPGAFAGLRIGLAAARGLALARGIPLRGISTTQILAVQAVRQYNAPVAVVLETKRADFYVQCFDENARALTPPDALDPAATEAFIEKAMQGRDYRIAGDGAARLRRLPSDIAAPDAALMAALLADGGAEYFADGIEPIYLRGADVSISKRQNRVLEDGHG